MFGLFGRGTIRGLAPEEVAEGLAAGKMLLVNVREPNETARERIFGALLAPLSRFDALDLPDPQGRTVVFVCASGMRSIKAAEIAQTAGLAYDAHLTGGITSGKLRDFRSRHDWGPPAATSMAGKVKRLWWQTRHAAVPV